MKATSIRYGRVKSYPGFCNEHIEIELELAEGERAEDALEKARIFVRKAFGELPGEDALRSAQLTIADRGAADDLPF